MKFKFALIYELREIVNLDLLLGMKESDWQASLTCQASYEALLAGSVNSVPSAASRGHPKKIDR